MSKKIELGNVAVAAKKTWKTPNIESFAVAGITESDINGVMNDGINSNSSTTS